MERRLLQVIVYAEALLTLRHLDRLRGELIFSKDDCKMQKSVNET